MKIKSFTYLVLAVASNATFADEPAPVPPVSDTALRAAGQNFSVQQVIEANQYPNLRQASATTQSSQIRQTRFAEEKSRRSQRKRTGLFRRMFGTRAQEDSQKIPDGVGAPPPKIPAPPRLTYATQGPGIGQRKQRVPSRNVSYSKTPVEQPQAQAPPGPGTVAYDVMPEIIPTPKSMAPRAANSRFIDPFANQPKKAEPNFLLDLDSIAPKTATGPAEPRIPAKTVSEVTLKPALKRPAESTGGFQLEESVLDLHASPTTIEVIEAPVPRPRSTPPIQQARPIIDQRAVSPSAKSSAAETDDTGRYTEIPLLVEPEMQQPTVPQPQVKRQVVAEPAPASLEVSDAGLISTDTAEEFSTADPTAAVVPVSPSLATQTPALPLKAKETQARRSQQMYRIMARTGQSGFKGFCPVALRDQRDLIDAQRRYKAKFGLQTYYFSSPEAKTRFETNPTRYAPAAGGSDVVLLVNTGEEETGSLDFSLWYRDRLYLFRSRETRALFSENPTRFAREY